MGLIESTVVVIAAYAVGAVPTAYVVARWVRGVDVRRVGSGNVGAVNVFKEVGLWPGLLVLAADVAKGAVVMGAILLLDPGAEWAFAAALAVTVGHNFSVFLRFAGGKGVAVVFGLSLVVFPVLTALSLIALPVAWLASRSIVWSFLATFVVLNVLTAATGQAAADVGLCVALSAVVIATHLWRTRGELAAALRRLDLAGIGKIE